MSAVEIAKGKSGIRKQGVIRKIGGLLVGAGVLRRSLSLFRLLLWNDSAKWGYEVTRDSLRGIRQGGSRVAGEGAETFVEACARFELSEADLEVRRDYLAFQGLMFRVIGYLSLVAGLGAGAVADSFFWFALLIMNGLCATAMFFGLAFARLFRAWQIEQRTLASVGAFVKAGGIYRTFLW